MSRNCQQVIRNVEIKAIYVGELARLARDLGTNMIRIYTGYERSDLSYDKQYAMVVECLQMAWKINWWARLEDGDHAHKILKAGLTYIGPKNPSYKGGGTYPNLFDGHPPFQIDGNFGGTAGITEMLLQSYDGMITLLPALPAKWSEGEVKGLRAKGGFTINMEWTKDNISKATVLSELGGNCRIRIKVPVKVLEMQSANVTGENPNPYFRLDPVPEIINNSKVPLLEVPVAKEYMIDFMTEKGKAYIIVSI